MIWLCVVLGIICVVLLFPIKISAEYAFSHSADKSIFSVKIFGFEVYRPEDESDKENEKDRETDNERKKKNDKITAVDIKEFLRVWNDEKAEVKKSIKKIFKNLKKLANLKKAEIDLTLGTDDAAQTGLVFGGLYGFVYGIFSVLYHNFKIKKKNMKIDLKPDFNGESAELYVGFEFGARIIFAIFALWQIMKLYFLIKKEVN